MDTQQPLIVILGPTASGKSGLAVDIARLVGGEVISADSRQVYQILDIGTEKITADEMHDIPHHCIDIAPPTQSLSVEEWRTHARKALSLCHKNGTLPILAGGTGLYIDALVFNSVYPAVTPDTSLRTALALKTPEELYALLVTLDPVRAETIERKNPRRLIRAIEIARTLGHVPPLMNESPCFDVTWIGITPPFPLLEERIKTRLTQALARGLVAETESLHTVHGLSWERIDELGMEYRICAQHLRDALAAEDLLETLYREVRRYAKRQLTWLKRYKSVTWYPSPLEALACFPSTQHPTDTR